MSTPLVRPDITGVILAGGQGRRMGGLDKGLLIWQGRPLVEHLIERLMLQVANLCISANRNIDTYQAYGLPVLSDQLNDFQGPLAGIAAALTFAKTPFIVVAPCDAPLIPSDLAQRLWDASQQSQVSIVMAHDGQRQQTLHALIATELCASLHDYLQRGERKVETWYQQHAAISVDFSAQANNFRNLNTPEELADLESTS